MTNDIIALESKFYGSLGNGVKAGEYLYQLIDACVTSRDTTILVKAIRRAEEKGDKAAASVVRFVTGQVFPGAKTVKAKTGMTIKIKGIDADTGAMGRFKEAVSKGLSIRHSAFRKTIMPDTDTSAEFDMQKYAKTIKARLEKEHANLEAMIAALQALRDGAVNH